VYAARLPLTVIWLGSLCSAFAVQAEERNRSRPSVSELAGQIDHLVGQLKTVEDNLKVVEAEYSQRVEPTQDQALNRRFSEGEVQYLLGDHPGASVLFYDLIEDPKFKSNPRYHDALFYLAEALYQQKNYLGARLYLKQLLALDSNHHRVAVARFMETAGYLNDFAGIDDYVARARDASGNLPPEIAYVYGKWFFRRTDLPRDERLKRATQVFTPLANDSAGPLRLQAQYFLGVADVQSGDNPSAVEKFRRITQERARDERDSKVKELANLSLGRVLFELGQYDDAIDRYQEIPRESEYFVDSLFEIAWAQVKKGQFERAKGAADILLLVSPESTLAPEAQILQAHLLLKLQRYAEATETYDSVVSTYRPVRDELDSLLTVNKDPVAYFDNLLARNEKTTLDVNSLLPPVAVKWATTQREVTRAVHMVSDLEAGRRGIAESEEIARRVLKALDERGLETFPSLQEGYTRADTIDSALARTEESLVRIEGQLIEDHLTPAQRLDLDQYRSQQASLQKRVSSLPTTQGELEERKKRIHGRIDEVDREAFKLEFEIQSMLASITAIDKWLEDTRASRKTTPPDEKEFKQTVHAESETLVRLQKQLEHVRAELVDQRSSAEASIAGEEAIRGEFLANLKNQHDLLSPAESNVPPDAARLVQQAHQIRLLSLGMRERVLAAKSALREQVTRRGRLIQNKVTAVQALLSNYSTEVSSVSGDARNLVGRIAFDSFKRVRQQFYDLVLKADVGLVDVAFTRKQDETNQIQKLSLQKDQDLRALDNEFKEVLKEVD
jgi:tetratricopeptide (TPR) repeat protein